jgi:Ricin-type beta-trefoil lectin domain
MMRGIRHLVVYAAVTGLLAAGAVSASLEVAHADTFAAACGGNGENDYICNLDATVSSPGSISVAVDSGSASENLNVNWTVTCGSQNQLGATDNATTPFTVPLTPLPATAGDNSCTVNVGISLPKPDITPKIDYTGTLSYTAAGSSSSSPGGSAAVHPVKGYGGKCLDDKGNSSSNGAAVVIWGCSGSDQAESWKYSSNELVHNGKCLNDKADGASGSKVILYTCNGGSNEKWSELSNGELRLAAHGGALCLDDPHSSTTNGTQLIVYACSASVSQKARANQKWSLP